MAPRSVCARRETAWCSNRSRRPTTSVEAAIARTAGEAAISVIVQPELIFGALRSARVAADPRRVEALPFAVLPLASGDTRVAADMRAILAERGQQIGAYDTLIAGQALARDLTLVTHNTREFAPVPGLRLEDWEA